MKRTGYLFVLAMCACAGFIRPLDPPASIEVHVKAERFTGSNGVDIFVLPVPGSKVVQLDVRFSVGAAHDPSGKAGLAHLVEHLMFEIKVGTNGETVTDELARLAHDHNAYTRYDSTHYVTRVAPEHLDAVVGVYANMLQAGCRGLDADTFAHEREIVRNEIREHHARPSGKIPQLLLDAVYGKDHAYGHLVGGDDQQISGTTLADACGFIARHYVGSRSTFLFAGGTTQARVQELAGKWLVRIPKRPRSRLADARPIMLKRGKIVTHELDISEPRLFVMWALPKTYSHQGRVAEFAGPELREVLEWFADTYLFANDLEVTTMGGVHAPVLVLSMALKNMGTLDEALDMVWKSVARVPRELAPNAGSGSYPNQLRNWKTEAIISRYEVLEQRVSAFADYAQFDPQGGFLPGHVTENDRITNSEMRRTAAAVLNPKKAIVVLIKPRPGTPSGSGSGQAYRGKIHQANRGVMVDAADAEKSLPVPAAASFRRQVRRYQLGNGLTIVLWPNAELPLVRATMLLRVGSAHEPDSRPGVARVAANGMGGFATMDSTMQTERGLSSSVHNTLRVGTKYIRHEFFEMDKLRARIKKLLGFRRDVQQANFAKQMLVGVYGLEHPYAQRGWLTKKSATRIDRDSTYSFADKHYVAANATLIVTGQFDTTLVLAHIKYSYSHWSSGKPNAPVSAPATKRKAALRVAVDSGASPVTELRVMYAGNIGIDGSFAARTVLEKMLSERLSTLREKRGLTYGITARYKARRGPGRWVISGSVDSRRVTEAVRALQSRIASLRTMDELFAGDFVLARRTAMQELLTAASDGVSINERLVFMAEHNLPPNFYERYGKALAKLRPADIKELIDRELTDTQQVLGVFGPASASGASEKR